MSALAASLALGLAGAAQAQPTVINVQLDEYKYAPMQIDLHAGQAYVFHLTNTGSKDHDLSAKAFFATVTLAPASALKVKNGDVDVDEGESADIAFTPNTPGTYEMHCTRPFHQMLGMKGQIVVH
jgi:uncharacterized cupredoxin-like copper-binding protein